MSRGYAIALFCLVVAACSDSGGIPSNVGCFEDSDCEQDLACSFNHCVVPSANHLAIAVRIIPPPNIGLVPQQVPTLPLDDGPDRLVKLLEPTILRGTIRPANNPLVTNLEGDLEVRTDGDIAGLDFVFSAHSQEGLDNDGYGFRLPLLPGRAYSGIFRAADPTLPRHAFRLEPDDIADGHFDLILPARPGSQPEDVEEYLVVKGRVMQSDYTAVLGARIVVLTAAGDVAAVTSSDTVRGLFEVFLPPEVTSFKLQVESPSAGPVFPEFVSELQSYALDGSIDLIVPDLPPGTEPVSATIRVTEQKAPDEAAGIAAEVVPAVGRTVTIVGDLAGGTLRRTGTTDTKGEVTFQALPGAYECLVASPPQAAAATWHDIINLAQWTEISDNEADVVEIQLAPRVPFVGHVTDVFGMPVEAGKLTLERRRDRQEGDALVIAPPPFVAELGPDGVFIAAVDPGTYDVLVQPDSATGAPNSFETELVVGDEGLRFDLGLPPPGLLHLTVADPQGRYIQGAQVELWIDDDLGEPRLLASGSTGDDGFVDLIVPHLGEVGGALIEWPASYYRSP